MASVRAFRQKFKAALDEIRRAGVIASCEIVDDMVHVVKIPTPSQQRYLARQEQQ